MDATGRNNPASFQPVAPQASGGILYGRFGQAKDSLMSNWKMIAGVVIVVLVAWWIYKRFA